MNKQKVNTTSPMKKKGYSSSSHYRIKSVAKESEQNNQIVEIPKH